MGTPLRPKLIMMPGPQDAPRRTSGRRTSRSSASARPPSS
uniref:Uncharacterized protein n=1 Tax=Arundo donax TaxID=35708 RepID=A0A0A9BT09_ARUDO